MSGKSHVGSSSIFADLDLAASAIDLPLLIWTLDSTIRLANNALSQLLDKPIDALLGESLTTLTNIFSPRPDIEATLAYFGSGEVDSIGTPRELQTPGKPPVKVWVWSRMLDVGDEPMGITIFFPTAVCEGSGSDPASSWRELRDVAIGVADDEWTVLGVSADIRGILGVATSEVVGSPLRSWVHPEDTSLPDGAGPGIQRRVRVRNGRGDWAPASLVWVAQPGNPKRRFFALVPMPGPIASPQGDRVAELELRLRRIGAEVQAAGVLDGIGLMPTSEMESRVMELTTRQWDIVSRLVTGQSARTIARDLYLSPSTVRNHLSAIYRKFGIHSQVELVRMFA